MSKTMQYIETAFSGTDTGLKTVPVVTRKPDERTWCDWGTFPCLKTGVEYQIYVNAPDSRKKPILYRALVRKSL